MFPTNILLEQNTPPNQKQNIKTSTSRIFKILNPELFFSPKKFVYVPGTMVFVGIIGYFVYNHYTSKNITIGNKENDNSPRKNTYLEKLEELKREK
ncbi:hypothetical protein BB559_001057 [Furculomyces boomerangus]|uniref:Uncharacterized protein n=2 Tax=Harpellales TaxID=61421 RepID=A0A2T9Z396_9FUNG|nr:hypothetical protein BB559_001057 [Furculomyces boomerangus]PVZ98302.1 hypothetical protein BB558_005700 [Smittium angustum]